MKSQWQEYKETVSMCSQNFRRFLKYQLTSKLILMILLAPLFSWVFDFLLKSRGMTYMTNSELRAFFISPQGMVLVLFSVALGFFILLLELGGLIVVAYQVIQGEDESSFVEITKYLFKKSKYLLGVDGLLILLYFIILAPLMDNELQISVLQELEIPGFIMDVIESNDVYFLTLTFLVVLIIILSIRWMFSMHVLILREQSSRHFLRESRLVLKGNVKKVFSYIIKQELIELIWIGFYIILFIVGSIGVLLVTPEAYIEMTLLILFSSGFLVVLILSFFYIPMMIIRLTKIYCQVETKTMISKMKPRKKEHLIDRIINQKGILVLGVFLGLIIIGVGTYFYYIVPDNIIVDVKVTAHRGSSKASPENTLSAVEQAMLNQADYAEIDVRLTKDGEVVLIHDGSLKRTTGVNRNVWELDLDEIKTLDAGSWYSSDYEGEQIPTLKEVIELSRGKIKLNIEIKNSRHTPELIQRVIDVVREENFISQCVMTSLNYKDLVEIEVSEPRIDTGYIMFVAIGDLEDLPIDFYSVEETNVTRSFVEKAHSIGREVHVWTINTRESMEDMIEIGVDNIITDDEVLLREIITGDSSN